MADYKVNLQLAVKGFKDLKQLNKQVDEARKRLNEASDRSKVFNSRVKDLIITEKSYKTAVTQRTRAIDNAARSMSGMQTLEQREQQLLRRGNKLRDLRLRKEKALTRQQTLKRGAAGAIGSGIIGGAFPLLFGQGPLSAIGGGLGGAAGGALSAIPGMAQFGFALSVAGTAIGSAMEDLTEAIKKPEDNIDNLINKLGLVGSPTAKLAKELENMGLKSSASKLLLDKFNERLGQSPAELLKTTEHITEFKNQISLLGTGMTLFLSNILTPFIKAINGSLTQGKLLSMLRDQVGEKDMFRVQQGIVDRASRLTEAIMATTTGPDREKTRAQLKDEFITIGLREALGIEDFDGLFREKQGKEPTLADKTFKVRELDPISQKIQLEKDRFKLSTQDLNIKKEDFKLTNLKNELQIMMNERENAASDLRKASLNNTISKLKKQIELQEQIVISAEALADPFRQLSNIIAQDIGNGIKGLIKGTETLNDVLRNVLDKLIDASFNMAFFGNMQGSLGGGGLFGSVLGGLGGIFGGKSGGSGGGKFLDSNAVPLVDPLTGIGAAADGGRIPGGRPTLVGERGPELFTPGVSGMITPNHALGGSTTVVVNVDASGSSVEGDEQQGRELGRVISAAVQSELIQQKRPGGLLA